jgi:biotin carboxyl carrier protein
VIEERATVVTAAPAPAAAVAAPAAAVETGPTINAPLTGTFYRTSAPGKPNLADDGAVVEAGSPVCIVEAMKLMNAIKATKKCRIVAFLAKHGDAVSKGQALARIEWL